MVSNPQDWPLASEAEIEAARRMHSSDGEVEIDDKAFRSEAEGGCYVSAWVWVSDEDLAAHGIRCRSCGRLGHDECDGRGGQS